jgi:hypothetical protein
MNENNGLSQTNQIVELLKTKSILKLEVFDSAKSQFNEFKRQAELIVQDLRKATFGLDKQLSIEFKEKGDYYFELIVAGDLLVFFMHSNIFEFDKNHYLWQSKYVKQNPEAVFCGQITVYNFLADSFKYNRENDIGYPIARVFINKYLHYLADGKGKIGQKHSDFSTQILNPEKIADIILDLVLYCMDFDLFIPPFLNLPEISVGEVMQISDFMTTQTGKRLGFKFSAEEEML